MHEEMPTANLAPCDEHNRSATATRRLPQHASRARVWADAAFWGRREAASITRQDVARQTSGAGAKAADVLNGFPLLPGKLITGQTFAVGTNTTVIHGLGRVPKGWFQIAPRNYTSGTATVGTEVSRDANTLVIGPFANYTADIYVFG